MHPLDCGPFPGEYYRHFKGGMYLVLYIPRSEDSKSYNIVYRSCETGEVWCRSLEEFNSYVESAEHNYKGLRFMPVSEEDILEEYKSLKDTPVPGDYYCHSLNKPGVYRIICMAMPREKQYGSNVICISGATGVIWSVPLEDFNHVFRKLTKEELKEIQ